MGMNRGDSQKRLAFVVMLDNDSMLPRYRRGALLYIDTSRTPKIGAEVYVETSPPAVAVFGVLQSRRRTEVCVKPYAAEALHLAAPTRIGRIVPPEEFLL
jgi:phage repressor protein C with HTH and peptisase S24 domain